MSDLPSSWEWATIGELTHYIQRGKSPKYAERSELPVINQKCIRWDELQTQHLKFIHPDQFSAWDSARYIAPGDILWNSTGTGTVGRAYLVKQADCVPPKVVDSHVTIVRHVPDIDARYLFSWIKGPAVQDKIEEMCDGTTNQIELSRTAIANTLVPVAPAPEQARIANRLDTLLTRIQACNNRFDAIPALLKRFRQSALTEAVSGLLTQQWRTEHGEPDWGATTVSSICQPGRVITYGVVKLGDEVTDGTPCLRTSNVRWLRFELEGMKRIAPSLSSEYARTILRGGEVLVNVRGTLGGVAVVRDEMAGWNISREVAVVPVDRGVVNPYFAAYWVASETSQRWLAGMEKGIAYVGINIEDLRNLPIRLPSLKEQAEIVRRVEALLSLADRVEARYITASAQAKRLIPLVLAKAFRGELVPQDPTDESARKLLERVKSAKAGGRKNNLKGSSPKAVNMKYTATSTREEILKLPYGVYSFDRLRSLVPADYETLKDAIFLLLNEPSSGLKQVFDKAQQSMVFERYSA